MAGATHKALRFTEFVSKVLGVTFTPGQQAFYSVACDGVAPRDLVGEQRELARKMFGPIDEVPALARDVVVQVKGARVGGTYFGALRMLHLALTLPLDQLAPGELASAPIVAPDMRAARQAFRYVSGAAGHHPVIAKRIAASTGESITISRDDGRHVRIECLPATRGGSALRGRSLVGVLLNECAFFKNEGYEVNDDEIYKAVEPRVLPRGQIIIESTPFAEAGLIYNLFTSNHGAPVTALAARCPTLVMRIDQQTIAQVERERLRDQDNYAREFDANFMTAGSGLFFDPAALDRCVRAFAAPPSLPYAAADFGFVRDSSALAVAGTSAGHVVLTEPLEMRPTRGNPLQPSRVAGEFAKHARSLGATRIMGDTHYAQAMAEHLAREGVTFLPAPAGNEGKVMTHLRVRELVNAGKLVLPPNERLLAQLKALVSKPLPGGGLSISHPRRAGQGHGDIASAAILAIYQAASEFAATAGDVPAAWTGPYQAESLEMPSGRFGDGGRTWF